MKCECGSTDFKEVIDKGIKQEITYEDGYIVKEETTYSKDRGKAVCQKCGKEYDEYEL